MTWAVEPYRFWREIFPWWLVIALVVILTLCLSACMPGESVVEAPPPFYDHPFNGKVTITYLTTVQIHTLCGSPTASACAPIGAVGECRVWMNKVYKKYKGWREAILRHEEAHCNGWIASHPQHGP